MSRITNLLLTVVGTLIFSTSAIATGGNSILLNTGLNNGSGQLYGVPGVDNYWINISSYPPSNPVAPAPAYTIIKHPQWAFPFANTSWISARPTWDSAPGTDPSNPAYTIFRKCFCLQQGFTMPSINLSVRGDDNIEIWLNNLTNVVVDAQYGRLGINDGPPITATHTTGFVAGRNCLYVLLEDRFFGATGFNLEGTAMAFGLTPIVASGVNASFAPCSCNTPLPNDDRDDQPAESRISDQDEQMIKEILEIREARRRKP